MKRDVDLFVRNCQQLLTLKNSSRGPRRGAALSDLGLVENGALAADGGRVVAAGTFDEVASVCKPVDGCVDVDAGGALVMPGFVDCHTHTVFAAYRLDEYEKRVAGVPYAEIAKSGGGIAKSVSDIRAMDVDTLLGVSKSRLDGCIAHGSTTVEIKSGYGLDLNNELKQLRVIRALAESSPATIVPTFLGAHSIPPEYRERREAYIDLVVREMIPAVTSEGLAEFIDVFSEVEVFTTEEAERILREGAAAGLRPRVHADELYDTASAEMAVRVGAVSADHLTKISAAGMSMMADSDVIGVLLPGTSFGLPSLHFAPARDMIERGMAIAIASDFNPGSSPSESMSMMISIACSHMRMTAAEAVSAATYNAAFALCRQNDVGSLEPGKRADFLVMNCEDYREIPYRFGTNRVHRVFIGGVEWTGNQRELNFQ
ncbi:MAG: imidazolonepropionase [Candidatus Latescibacterota bacterium]|nr:MAG: imidazolonepropionase [Candidatus Latescibacterota bacterium]